MSIITLVISTARKRSFIISVVVSISITSTFRIS